MKKLFFLYAIILTTFLCCKNKVTVIEKTEMPGPNLNIVESPLNAIGSYVGVFGDNKITILITKENEDSVAGRSIVAGNDRPFVGTLKNNNNIIEINAKEPGDDKHDGIFKFTLDNKNPEILSGSWTAYKSDVKDGHKTFSLNRKSFAYLKNVGNFPEASTRLLTEEDVNNKMKEDLELMRNEIYARHGYCFVRKSTREQFENFDWYIPNSTDIKKDITAIEKQNIKLIKKFEKYADDFGDDFGR